MPASSPVTTFLFTDIEGSTRLWEQAPDAMRPALARHDAIVRDAVTAHHGHVVKSTGDGVHAAFDDPLDAIRATLALQHALNTPDATGAIAFRVRCGLHVGHDERRDNDFYGATVNRAARIMSVAHGGQMLASQALAERVASTLPEGVTLRDLGVVRLRDLADPERVFQIVDPGLRQDFPPLRSLETTPNNLPQQLTSFIGRARELAEVRAQLASTRLLTLLGIGGLGKSRLSLQVAAEVLDAFPDGVWFVELAPVSDPRLVPQVLASLMGVREEAGGSVLAALVKYVRDRTLLVILDNCEHLTQACAELARALLEAGPRVKLMASSRENLNLRGETTYPLAPLALPDPAKKVPLDVLLQGEAVRLFVDRARAALPTFAVSESNAGAVAAICRRLDGIPLALELAAARVRTLSVENIAERLRDRFRLLSGGDRTALPRQQTLRALIDWSFDLLTDAERVLFGRLSVFAGGFTLEAAEAVGAGGDLDEADILDLLAHLVAKSLVVMEPGGARYRMLETVRQYAQEKLAADHESEPTHQRHLVYFGAFAERARAELVGPDQGIWLGRLDFERENFMAAHIAGGRALQYHELGAKLVRSLKLYWINRGLLELGYRTTVETIARDAIGKRDLTRCRGLFDAGQFAYFMGNYQEARSHLDDSLSIARELGDAQRVAAVLQPLGMACLGQGAKDEAKAHLDEALSLASSLGNRREFGAALNALAQFHRAVGELDRALPLYNQFVAIAQDLGDRESVAIGLLNLAMVAIGQGDSSRAGTHLRDVLPIVEETGSRPLIQSVLEVSAGLAAMRKDWAFAARWFGAAQTQAAETGLRPDPADEAFLAPLIDRCRTILGKDDFAASAADGRAVTGEAATSEVRAWLLQTGNRPPSRP